MTTLAALPAAPPPPETQNENECGSLFFNIMLDGFGEGFWGCVQWARGFESSGCKPFAFKKCVCFITHLVCTQYPYHQKRYMQLLFLWTSFLRMAMTILCLSLSESILQNCDTSCGKPSAFNYISEFQDEFIVHLQLQVLIYHGCKL